MIESITLKNVATFSDEKFELKMFNYIFGCNGSGKTTISRVVADKDKYDGCDIAWTNNVKQDVLVYNTDFVKSYFRENENLPGVFTLGKDSIELKGEFDKKTSELEKLKKKIVELSNELNNHSENNPTGKEIELENLEKNYQDIFWSNGKYKKIFSECLERVKGSKKDFFNKVLAEYNNKDSTTMLLKMEDLKSEIAKIYNKNLSYTDEINQYNSETIFSLENDNIMNQPIIGSRDVNISEMIEKLNNSDWIRQGKNYLEKNDNKCPFCQRELDNSFRTQLYAYFDDTYTSNLQKINHIKENYVKNVGAFNLYLSSITEIQKAFIDDNELQKIQKDLNEIFSSNIRTLNDKIKEPSRCLKLESSVDKFKTLLNILIKANLAIRNNNNIFQNLSDAKKDIKEKVWKFIITDLSSAINIYIANKNNLEEKIRELHLQIKELNDNKKTLESEISNLNKKITSVKPVCDSINKTLKSFGFSNFYLSTTNDNSYKIMRNETEEVKDTLSEGEKNFLTFLYFYNLINGNIEQTKNNTPQVIVIDDPISSLDNNVLFVVSSMVKDLIDNALEKRNKINQIIILTHNISFFKEITKMHYKTGRFKNKIKFFIVNKVYKRSTINGYDENPIKSSYELLWNELKNNNSPMIQNTMRRILETYFVQIGNKTLHELPKAFDGEEKNICKSLIAWIESGSHQIYDDSYYTPLNTEQRELYLDVFHKIFETQDQLGHYNMMMGIDNNEEGE